METSFITALAAATGSIVGATASVSASWISQHKKRVGELTRTRLHDREALYGEFIMEAWCLAVDAVSHSLESLEKLVNLYGFLVRSRLPVSKEVLAEAEQCCR